MGEDYTYSREVIIKNKLGLHARAATLFVQTANRFQAEILINKDGAESNGKSILSLMGTGASQGCEMTITAKGNDALEAIDALEQLIESRFGEE